MTDATIYALPVNPRLKHINRQLWKMRASQKAAVRASQDGSRIDMVLLAKQFKQAEDRYVNILLKEMSNA